MHEIFVIVQYTEVWFRTLRKDIVAVFATEDEAHAWLDQGRPGWREVTSDIDVERWKIGIPEPEAEPRDELVA